ncbi:hypothetical protein C8J56DRAFT_1049785 [Mycena floridula]|nr:hypothetical protein C8J56DRAFT_1049785 [Mycena floridula]
MSPLNPDTCVPETFDMDSLVAQAVPDPKDAYLLSNYCAGNSGPDWILTLGLRDIRRDGLRLSCLCVGSIVSTG